MDRERFHITMSTAAHRKLKIAAGITGLSIGEVVEALLDAHQDEPEPEHKPLTQRIDELLREYAERHAERKGRLAFQLTGGEVSNPSASRRLVREALRRRVQG